MEEPKAKKPTRSVNVTAYSTLRKYSDGLNHRGLVKEYKTYTFRWCPWLHVRPAFEPS